VLVCDLVDSKAWDPSWQEVITLFAGQLHDPTPLLRLLADATQDDLFRHRLALAVLCLPEIQVATRSAQAAIVDDITSAAFSFCNTSDIF
jgi:ABC-type phosphate transport system permease subunit